MLPGTNVLGTNVLAARCDYLPPTVNMQVKLRHSQGCTSPPTYGTVGNTEGVAARRESGTYECVTVGERAKKSPLPRCKHHWQQRRGQIVLVRHEVGGLFLLATVPGSWGLSALGTLPPEEVEVAHLPLLQECA